MLIVPDLKYFFVVMFFHSIDTVVGICIYFFLMLQEESTYGHMSFYLCFSLH